MINIKLTGFKELEKNLRELPEKLAQNALKSSVSASAKIVRDAARKNAPVDSGKLKENIIHYRSRRNSSSGKETFFIGIRTITKTYADTKKNKRAGRAGKKYKVFSIPYWRFVEFGTKAHTINLKRFKSEEAKKLNKSVLSDGETIYGTSVNNGGIKSKPFLRPAFDNNKTLIIDTMRVGLSKGIEKQIKKMKK